MAERRLRAYPGEAAGEAAVFGKERSFVHFQRLHGVNRHVNDKVAGHRVHGFTRVHHEHPRRLGCAFDVGPAFRCAHDAWHQRQFLLSLLLDHRGRQNLLGAELRGRGGALGGDDRGGGVDLDLLVDFLDFETQVGDCA